MTQPNIDRLYFARSGLAHTILTGYEANSQTATTIFAPRRKGKTTFVRNDLIPLARERGFLVAIADLWLDKENPERVIARALQEAIHGTGIVRRNLIRFTRPEPVLRSLKGGAGPTGVTLGADFADDAGLVLPELFERFSRLGKGRALLIVDEVQHLGTRKEFETFTATLRTLLQSAHGSVFALFTGSSQHGLARMFRRSKAPFYQYGSEVAFPELGMEFANHLGALYQETTGKPWETAEAFNLYVQRGMMPKHLRDIYTLSLTQGLTVNEADKIVWKTMLDEGQFETLIENLPMLDQALLVGILTNQPLFSADYRNRLGDELPSGVAPSSTQVQAALKRLQRAELVGNLDHGNWCIEDGALESFLRRWLLEDQADDA
ncbi:hypothetical protein [Pseudomonas triclosanedens]|uniref:hypothetical protein n=1 Tax=Pseudomonas triclosanedens TaxID=2961893 RepID=UPI0020C1FE88|nr:hypothetical protein [Pseudomonas triclosanedens]ELR2939947.1 hypothetical protein [Pseudomonas aeruginosa]MCP8473812.1 hypothetical protein [Pseudomonas triclosanedens]